MGSNSQARFGPGQRLQAAGVGPRFRRTTSRPWSTWWSLRALQGHLHVGRDDPTAGSVRGGVRNVGVINGDMVVVATASWMAVTKTRTTHWDAVRRGLTGTVSVAGQSLDACLMFLLQFCGMMRSMHHQIVFTRLSLVTTSAQVILLLLLQNPYADFLYNFHRYKSNHCGKVYPVKHGESSSDDVSIRHSSW